MSISEPGGIDDSVERFAADLRELRLAAGDAKLVALSDRVGVSKSVLSEALTGRRLPTERTVIKLVEELGGNREAWVTRRNALDPRTAPGPSQETNTPVVRRYSLVQTILIAGVAALVAVGATSAFWSMARGSAAEATLPENAEGPYLAAANGVDPMRTACKDDSIIAASESRMERQVHVQLLYSNDCMSVWGRVTRYDDKSAGNSLSMKIYPESNPESKRSQSRTAEGLQSLYTEMIVEPDVDARICGVATATVDGKTIELGPPLCA